jgi:hypothetical protein
MKNDVNVPSKSNKQNTLKFVLFFLEVLMITDSDPAIFGRIQIQIH